MTEKERGGEKGGRGRENKNKKPEGTISHKTDRNNQKLCLCFCSEKNYMIQNDTDFITYVPCSMSTSAYLVP